MNMELERFADLLTYLIEKYAGQIDLSSLPDMERPTTKEVVGLIRLGFCLLKFLGIQKMRLIGAASIEIGNKGRGQLW